MKELTITSKEGEYPIKLLIDENAEAALHELLWGDFNTKHLTTVLFELVSGLAKTSHDAVESYVANGEVPDINPLPNSNSIWYIHNIFDFFNHLTISA